MKKIRLSSLAWFLTLALLFALSYSQAPLYSSNQHQYFLHGLAQSGYGTLAEDWLANTADPTPVFSLLVAVTLRLFHFPGIFYFYYALLMGIYLFSLIGIVAQVFPIRARPLTFALFIALVIALHSAGLRYLLLRGFGEEWPYLFEGGVAGQRLLGPVFQPSSFGVFLLLSIYLYLNKRPVWAVLAAVLAATFHPTYLLSAALLTLAYVVDTLRQEGRLWPALRLGLLALAAVSPILLYTYLTFGGSTPEATAQAHHLLVSFRIPYHTQVRLWFDATVVIKMAFLAGALYLIRKRPLFTILAVPSALVILLTLLQFVSQNDFLALLFPWRPSTWLVPIAVALLVGKLTLLLRRWTPPKAERLAKLVALTTIALAATAGVFRFYYDISETNRSPIRPLEMYVAAHRQPGQLYLIPRKIYDFRTVAGVPIYVDFLAIPYRDSDLLEWRQRYLTMEHFYNELDCSVLTELSAQGVTHVVLPVDFPRQCPGLQPLYQDTAYELYLLQP